MRKIILFIIVIAAVGLGIYFLTAKDGRDNQTAPDLSAEVSNITVRGVVTEVNLQQAMVDGPYLVAVREEDGDEVMIAVPSMAIDMCVAKPNITHPSEIKAGMTVEAVGALSSDGNVIPCESSNHHLRVVTR